MFVLFFSGVEQAKEVAQGEAQCEVQIRANCMEDGADKTRREREVARAIVRSPDPDRWSCAPMTADMSWMFTEAGARTTGKNSQASIEARAREGSALNYGVGDGDGNRGAGFGGDVDDAGGAGGRGDVIGDGLLSSSRNVGRGELNTDAASRRGPGSGENRLENNSVSARCSVVQVCRNI